MADLAEITGLAGEEELLDLVIWEPLAQRKVSLWTGIDGQMAIMVQLSPETSDRWRKIFSEYGTYRDAGGT